MRSMLVGQEFAGKEKKDELYAPTPPLMAARFLVSLCASRGRQQSPWRMMVIDVKKAFLYGVIHRNVYIELPDEDPESQKGALVGKLDKAMYGTRDAPAMWQEELERTLTANGFVASVATPCVYLHPELGVSAVAHVDDILLVGPKNGLYEIRRRMETRYKLKSNYIGPAGGE